MVIFDETNNNELNNLTLLLKKDEVVQLIGYLNDLLLMDSKNEHYHINNDDYSKEITIALYSKDGELDHFAEKYRKIIIQEMG